jgi:hypothetical protein
MSVDCWREKLAVDEALGRPNAQNAEVVVVRVYAISNVGSALAVLGPFMVGLTELAALIL